MDEGERAVSDAQVRRDFRWIFLLFGVVISGRIVYFLVDTNPAPGFLGMAGWLGVGVLTGLETGSYFGSGLVLATALWNWCRAIHLLGLPQWSAIKDYHWVAIHMESRLRDNLTGKLAFLVFFTFLGFTFTHRFTAVGLVCQGVLILSFYMETLQPVAVLYLSTSAREKISLQARMKRQNQRIRIVALLDLQEVLVPGKSTDVWINMVIGNDCLRTGNQGIWKDVVKKLSRHTSLVVLDARDVTPSVVFEANHLLEAGYIFKTIFIVGPDGQSPLLRYLACELGSLALKVTIATEDTISPFIWHLTHQRAFLPTSERDLCSILNHDIDMRLRRLGASLELGTISTSAQIQIEESMPAKNAETDSIVLPITGHSAGEQSAIISPSKLSLPSQGATKCPKCRHWRPAGDWVCSYCGHADRLRIGTVIGFGMIFIIMALTLTVGWWRWGWLAVGGILLLIALVECIAALRARTHKL